MRTIHHITYVLWYSVPEFSSVIANDVAVSITVPIIVSVLFTTSIFVDVLSSSLKIQYTILRATTSKLDTDKICNDANVNMYTMFLCCFVHKSTIYYSQYHTSFSVKACLFLYLCKALLKFTTSCRGMFNIKEFLLRVISL